MIYYEENFLIGAQYFVYYYISKKCENDIA